jgi:hypothetical protein
LLPPPPPRAETPHDRPSEPDDEPTMLQPRPSPEALGLTGGAQGGGAPPRTPAQPRIVATLASMPAIASPNPRPVVNVSIAGDDDQRPTWKMGDAPALK